MSEHPQQPKPPAGQYGTGPGPGQQPPTPPTGQYPPTQPPTGQYPPGQQPPGQQPPGPPPTGQYPPTPPPGGQYPPTPPPGGQYPPPPSEQYPPPPTGQYPPPPSGQYPPTPPPTGQYPPTGQPPTGQYPQPPTGQYPKPTEPCPDPCDDRPWGPPTIDPECCPDDRSCCETPGPCTWDEVEDPCIRAAACADEAHPSTKLSCTCESSNEACTCEEWDCGGLPDGACVPCKPCEGLIPDPATPDPGGCEDPNGHDCSSESLRRQLEANKRCISARQAEKAKLEADIKARQERDKELATLISGYDAIIDKYKGERHKLICKEDCLKGFHRDISRVFQDRQRFPEDCLGRLQKEINDQLCAIERVRCCQKNLEWKLERGTRLVMKQKEAEKAFKRAEEAFAQIRDLPKWMGDQFTALEKLKDEIAQALNDRDPQKHNWAFYLFYWKFAPALCRRFKVAVCCPPPEGGEAAAVHIGCAPGDWHPSRIDDKTLRQLICCAWTHMKNEKARLQEATDEVDAVKQNLDFIRKKAEDDAKTLEERIKSRVGQVVCAGAGGGGAATSR